MNLQIELRNGVMTARLCGELDHHNAGKMREEIDGTAQRVKPDCSGWILRRCLLWILPG